MNKSPIIIVDADAIIAQADQNDSHHQTAIKISQSLANLQAHVVYPATAIAESNAYMQRVLGNTPSAYRTAMTFADPGIEIAQVNHETIKSALKFFSPTTSKKNTLFDCIVAAIAEEYNADAIFSFDRFYVKKGFTLAKNLK